MKIAIWHNLPSGGGKRALHSQVAQLIERGHFVEAWCPASADVTYLPLSELTVEHRLPFSPRRRPTPTRWQRLNALARPPRNPLLEEMDNHSKGCAEAIRKARFDFVFAAPCLFYRVPRIGRFLRGCGIPVVLYLQEPLRWVYEAQPELPWIAPRQNDIPSNRYSRSYWRYLLRDYERSVEIRTAARRELEDAKAYNRILVNSIFSRESVARIYGLDARVSYLGYDAHVFSYQHRERENFVLGLGSMDFIKGVDTAIETMGLLPVGLRCPLVWVANSGDEAYEMRMKELAVRRGVTFDVRHRTSDASLVDLLNRCQLLLYTSRLEPFGYAPLEATVCGAPVVAIAEGGVREIIMDGENGLLRERDANQLAAAVAELLGDRKLSRALGDRGAQMAPLRFSAAAATDQLLRHLEDCLHSEQAQRWSRSRGGDIPDGAEVWV